MKTIAKSKRFSYFTSFLFIIASLVLVFMGLSGEKIPLWVDIVCSSIIVIKVLIGFFRAGFNYENPKRKTWWQPTLIIFHGIIAWTIIGYIFFNLNNDGWPLLIAFVLGSLFVYLGRCYCRRIGETFKENYYRRYY